MVIVEGQVGGGMGVVLMQDRLGQWHLSSTYNLQYVYQ